LLLPLTSLQLSLSKENTSAAGFAGSMTMQ
jgi:hypothetical protein